MKGEVTL